MSRTNASSLIEERFISTFANAPSIAALANAEAVVRSDFMFGFVIGLVRGFLLRIMFRVQIGFGSVDDFLMFAVGFVFGIFASALGFLVLGVFVILFLVEMLVCLGGFFFLFVEGCATNQGVGIGARLYFLVLRFDHVGGKRGELLLIERGRAIVSGKRGYCFLRMFLNGSRDRLGDFGRS